ncbi:hypothetical protein QFC20_005310 [Naganishia adeliensis]|uniref:Uncharacterized protein n=1 Tax=Naganishia adeliensis TaxID=92952 RepID=A0ACC2VQM5_9TREE|nr:hypothetical protein QFC20_005310 [Naganishia adeliensis]
MGRGMKAKKGSKGPAPKSAPKLNGKDASIKRIDTYEDTLEAGGVDDFMHNRDKISLAPEQASDDEEDFIGNQGEEVLGLNLPDEDEEPAYDEDEYDEEEEEELPVKKGRKVKAMEDKTKKGRYGKDSDDDESLGFTDEESEADEDEDRGEESWGRQYYAKPSNRYARDADDDDYDSDKELSKSLYAQESEALQKSIRRSMKGEEDFGLDEVEEESATKADIVKFSLDRKQPTKKAAAPAPPADADPSKLITHLALHDPLKLALARDFPLVVRKLQKTERGIKRMQKDAARAQGAGDMPQLNQGLGWLHYQSLLTYATMLAFYLHLASLPEDQRPNFDTHPILPRLAQLKEGVAMLEDLDFDAASIDGEDEDEEDAEGLDDEEDEDVVTGKAELMARLVGTTGMDWDDADVIWEGGELEDGELVDLREDAAGELSDDDAIAGPGRRQIQLSGEESMLMTHWCVVSSFFRLLPTEEHRKTSQPIILDPHLRLPPSAKLFKTLRDPETPHAKAPWILCRDDGDSLFDERRRALESVGGRIVPVPMPNALSTLPRILDELGINSLMVEGGAQIIHQFLTTPTSEDGKPLVDLLVVTVAPVLVPDGLAVPGGETSVDFEHLRTEVMGRDAVMIFRGKERCKGVVQL